jgi:hypothetical protein
MKNVPFVKKSGFSYIEFLLSLFLVINLFVLTQQIIYNIDKEQEFVVKERILAYESIVLRIENHFKEVTYYNVGNDFLLYQYREFEYYYYRYNQYLVYQMDNKVYLLVDNIKAIHFNKIGYILYITFVELNEKQYRTQIIIYE